MTASKIELVPFVPEETNQTTIEHEWKPPELGSWWWCKRQTSEYDETADDYTTVVKTPLACVMSLGSNYAEVKTPHHSSWRVHFDQWDEQCTIEPNWRDYLHRKIEERKTNVRELLHEIQRVTAQLGIIPRDALGAESAQHSASQALATASGTANINAHKNALVKAKEKTLPDLFKRVEKEHDQMAVWMKAELLPALAEVSRMKESIGQINDRIFTVELYAGLVEVITQIADGKPAANGTPIHLFQRRHYMDEECLVNYQAGGMRFAHLGEFDKWLCKPENKSRILPMDRCVVAFKVRRGRREYDGDGSFSDFISFAIEADADELTFLYIRNGAQMFRLSTKIEFGSELFPDVDQDILLNQQAAWIFEPGKLDDPRSQREYEASWESYRNARSIMAAELWAWKRAGKPKDLWTLDERAIAAIKAIEPNHFPTYRFPHGKHDRPGRFPFGGDAPSPPNHEPFTTDSVQYDDVMAKIEQATKDHNRIAVVLQGLLDRSAVFQPHPPWRLWTAEGFNLAIKLVHDKTRVITSGAAPDFEAYRAQLNQTLKAGSITVGQQSAWMRAEAKKYNASARSERNHRDLKVYKPSGNPGPGLLAKARASRAGKLSYAWTRTRKSERSWRTGSYPTKFSCPIDQVLNVSAYTRGDYRIFYNDPRTRAQYLKWAPMLLAAEDYACGHVKHHGGSFDVGYSFDVDHYEEDKRAERAEKRFEKAAKKAKEAEKAERKRKAKELAMAENEDKDEIGEGDDLDDLDDDIEDDDEIDDDDELDDDDDDDDTDDEEDDDELDQ